MMGGVGLRAEITQLAASLCSDLHASNRKASLPALVLARGPSTSSSGSFSFSQGFLCWLWQAQTRVEMGQGWQVVEMFHRAAVSVGLFVGAGLVKPWDSASSSLLVYNVANPFALFVFHESFLITGGCSSGQGPLVLMATSRSLPWLCGRADSSVGSMIPPQGITASAQRLCIPSVLQSKLGIKDKGQLASRQGRQRPDKAAAPFLGAGCMGSAMLGWLSILVPSWLQIKASGTPSC